jgi:hypothetical protein
MRMQSVLLAFGAAVVLAVIWFATPQLAVTLNETGTEVLGVSLLKPVQPALAKPRE